MELALYIYFGILIAAAIVFGVCVKFEWRSRMLSPFGMIALLIIFAAPYYIGFGVVATIIYLGWYLISI